MKRDIAVGCVNTCGGYEMVVMDYADDSIQLSIQAPDGSAAAETIYTGNSVQAMPGWRVHALDAAGQRVAKNGHRVVATLIRD